MHLVPRLPVEGIDKIRLVPLVTDASPSFGDAILPLLEVHSTTDTFQHEGISLRNPDLLKHRIAKEG